MRFFSSNKWYGSFGVHNQHFLPELIPDITGLVFAGGNNEFGSKDPSFGHVGARFQLFPTNETRSKSNLDTQSGLIGRRSLRTKTSAAFPRTSKKSAYGADFGRLKMDMIKYV